MIMRLRHTRPVHVCILGQSCGKAKLFRVLILTPIYSSHLPLMFVGMEHITLSNLSLADEALHAAHSMCDGDPLLTNERGVMAFNHGE